MTKDELIQKIESEWNNLQASLDGLTEEQMHRPGVVGEWTIKDILAHITAWQTRLITTLFKAEKGFTPDTTEGGQTVDQMNEKFYREMKDRAFDQVWDDLDSSYHQLLSRLDRLERERPVRSEALQVDEGRAVCGVHRGRFVRALCGARGADSRMAEDN